MINDNTNVLRSADRTDIRKDGKDVLGFGCSVRGAKMFVVFYTL